MVPSKDQKVKFVTGTFGSTVAVYCFRNDPDGASVGGERMCAWQGQMSKSTSSRDTGKGNSSDQIDYVSIKSGDGGTVAMDSNENIYYSREADAIPEAILSLSVSNFDRWTRAGDLKGSRPKSFGGE